MLSFPANCKTPVDRTEYAYHCQELLRLLHNVMGKWFREGISSAEWGRLPNRVQRIFPYKDKLSRNEWDDFLVNIFEPASDKIIGAILEARALLKQSKRWKVDIEVLL